MFCNSYDDASKDVARWDKKKPHVPTQEDSLSQNSDFTKILQDTFSFVSGHKTTTLTFQRINQENIFNLYIGIYNELCDSSRGYCYS